MKRIFLTIIALLSSVLSFAQIKDTTFWNRNFEAGININQAGFSDSWNKAQGGVGSLAITAFLFTKSQYVQNRSSIINDLQLQYGRQLTDGLEDYLGDKSWRKNVDRIFIDNVYNYSFTNQWSAFGSVTFQTQFDAGVKYEKTKRADRIGLDSGTVISNLLAPGNLVEAAGLEWKPVPYFSARFGPVAFRQIFSVNQAVRDNLTGGDPDKKHNGVDYNTHVKNEFGLNVVAKFDKDLATNINLKLIGQYFSAYENLNVGTVRLDGIFTAKITRFINVNLTGVLLYNQEQIARLQANEQMAIGIVYKFNNVAP